MIIPVILSGGAGTRLWPLSRELYPKQLLPLVSDKTMLQETVARLDGLENVGSPLVVCNEAHRFMVAEQLRQLEIEDADIILEPCGRNTAPAVAVAALHARQSGDDPILLVLPADHVIRDVSAFQAKVEVGVELARQGKLVTFGIVPDAPETGYGYIKGGNELRVMGDAGIRQLPTSNTHQTTQQPNDPQPTAFTVDRFVEKPDLATAENYLSSDHYYWNSGMFMFRASVYLQELKCFNSPMLDACSKAVDGLVRDLDFLRLGDAAFAASPSDSIDYAVMEKTSAAAVIPLDAGWNDVGSWLALWQVKAHDSRGNVLEGDVLTEGVTDCHLYAEHRLLAAVGVDNLVVIETPDAVLVANKERVQDVKAIVEQLKESERNEAQLHRRVNRPWGAYEGVDAGERFQVKRITVNPGASLSLQMHHHRAEHWVVVRGTAKVTRGKETIILSENESTYIPLGEVHRLENPGKVLLEIIEVQSGSYLGEDDIVRIEDEYGR